jgi:uncharacterized protein (TIGR00369 family)
MAVLHRFSMSVTNIDKAKTGHRFPTEIPFLEWLGLEFVEAASGKSIVRLPMLKHHTNSFSVAHGGVQMTALDVAMAMAARSLFNEDLPPGEPQFGVVTIEMKSTFMAPALWTETHGGTLVVHGKCIKRTKQIAFCEAEIVDNQGAVLSKASGTFKAIRQRKLSD